ncbi:hypothetical protein ACQEVF_51270 [Nonomuraea polychroma]
MGTGMRMETVMGMNAGTGMGMETVAGTGTGVDLRAGRSRGGGG